MIQRIQSVYLFLAGIAMGILFLRNISMAKISGLPGEGQIAMNYLDDSILNIRDHNLLMVLCAIAVILSLGSIFLFRNRKLQLNLNKISMVVTFFVLAFALYLGYSDISHYLSSLQVTPLPGLFLPVIALILLALANKNIRKDDRLVKSMDRLR